MLSIFYAFYTTQFYSQDQGNEEEDASSLIELLEGDNENNSGNNTNNENENEIVDDEIIELNGDEEMTVEEDPQDQEVKIKLEELDDDEDDDNEDDEDDDDDDEDEDKKYSKKKRKTDRNSKKNKKTKDVLIPQMVNIMRIFFFFSSVQPS